MKTGEYQDRNGQTKGRWQRIGTVFRHDDGGTSIKLDCVPLGLPEWDGWVNVFKREDPQGAQGGGAHPLSGGFGGAGYHQTRSQGRSSAPPPLSPDLDDDIPF